MGGNIDNIGRRVRGRDVIKQQCTMHVCQYKITHSLIHTQRERERETHAHTYVCVHIGTADTASTHHPGNEYAYKYKYGYSNISTPVVGVIQRVGWQSLVGCWLQSSRTDSSTAIGMSHRDESWDEPKG